MPRILQAPLIQRRFRALSKSFHRLRGSYDIMHDRPDLDGRKREVRISGNMTMEDAKNLAARLSSGDARIEVELVAE